MTLKNNRALLLCCFQLCAWFHCHMWIQTGVRVRKRLSWVLTSVTLTFDLWKFHDDTMMGTWWKRCDRQTDGRTDGQTDWTSHIAAWSQLKIIHSRECIWKCCLQNGSHFVQASMCWHMNNNVNSQGPATWFHYQVMYNGVKCQLNQYCIWVYTHGWSWSLYCNSMSQTTKWNMTVRFELTLVMMNSF